MDCENGFNRVQPAPVRALPTNPPLPPGAVPVFTVSGCATSQSEVALTLERLRLIDGVASVSLKSSNQSSSGAGSGVGGVCPPNDPAYSATIEFAPLPASVSVTKPSATQVSNQGAAR